MEWKLRDLPLDELVVGAELSLENANLMSDAYCLYENKRYARAYTLYQLASEEIGKMFILYTQCLNIGEQIPIDLDKGFRDHVQKNIHVASLEHIQFSTMKHMQEDIDGDFLDKLMKWSFEEIGKRKEINARKNESLYVSLKDGKFKSPVEFSEKDVLERMTKANLRIVLGENLLKIIKALHNI